MPKSRRTTLQRLLKIALPMVVSQASDSIMMFADRVFLSRIGEIELSASMAGGLTMFMLSSLFIGTVGYVTAIVAQYYGAKRFPQCGEATFQSILIALFCYPILLALSPLVRHFFVLAGHAPLQIELGYLYFQTLIFGSVFLILRYALAGFFLGIGRTTVVMLANFAGMLINIPANYVLIFGKLGFPALGLQGAAIGTILGNATIFLILLLFYLRGTNRTQFNTNRSLRFRPQIMRRLLRFGIPAGFEMFLSVTAFNLFVQFMHSYGTDVAAAVTIAFNWDIVAFIPMLGMSHATTALVGQNIGVRIERGKHRFPGYRAAPAGRPVYTGRFRSARIYRSVARRRRYPLGDAHVDRITLAVFRAGDLPDPLCSGGSGSRLAGIYRLCLGLGFGYVPALPRWQVAAHRADPAGRIAAVQKLNSTPVRAVTLHRSCGGSSANLQAADSSATRYNLSFGVQSPRKSNPVESS
jgi:putative MATE family efflux protein